MWFEREPLSVGGSYKLKGSGTMPLFPIRNIVSPLFLLTLLTSAGVASPVREDSSPQSKGTGQQRLSPQTFQTHITYVGKNEGRAPLTFESFKGLIFFKALINGEPATVLLDNGFGHTVLDAGFARRIGVNAHDIEKSFKTGTGEMALGVATRITLDIPHQLHLSTAVGVVDFASLIAKIHHPIDAVVGEDHLNHMAIGIWPGRRALQFAPSGAIVPGTETHSRVIPLIDGDRIDAKLNGQPVNLKVDLGSDAMVSLSPTAWKRIFPNDSSAAIGTSIRAEGMNLTTRRLPDNKLAFSGFEAGGVVVESSGPLPDSEDGLLGEGILSHPDIILDIPAKKLVLMRDAAPSDAASVTQAPKPE